MRWFVDSFVRLKLRTVLKPLVDSKFDFSKLSPIHRFPNASLSSREVLEKIQFAASPGNNVSLTGSLTFSDLTHNRYESSAAAGRVLTPF